MWLSGPQHRYNYHCSTYLTTDTLVISQNCATWFSSIENIIAIVIKIRLLYMLGACVIYICF